MENKQEIKGIDSVINSILLDIKEIQPKFEELLQQVQNISSKTKMLRTLDKFEASQIENFCLSDEMQQYIRLLLALTYVKYPTDDEVCDRLIENIQTKTYTIKKS